MRFAVDAHAIGRHLTGNEVYVRNLLNGFASLDSELEFIAYLSTADAEAWVPSRFAVRRIAGNPFVRLGCDLSYKLRRDRPQLVHVQYTAPLDCPVPVVVSRASTKSATANIRIQMDALRWRIAGAELQITHIPCLLKEVTLVDYQGNPRQAGSNAEHQVGRASLS